MKCEKEFILFFSHAKELSPQMLARFTQIDYDREIALGKKLGFQVKSGPDGQDFELVIPLASDQGGVSRASQQT